MLFLPLVSEGRQSAINSDSEVILSTLFLKRDPRSHEMLIFFFSLCNLCKMCRTIFTFKKISRCVANR